jgi:exopolysaccharide production protein ExoQ
MSARVVLERIGRVPLSAVAETGFAILTIYLLSGGPLFLGSASDPGLEEGDSRIQGLLSVVYLLALVLTLKRPKTWWRATSSDLSLVALLAWTIASVMWSDAPDVTLRRSLALLGTSFVGVYLAARYSLESQLRLLGAGLGLVVTYNAYLAFRQPGVLSAGEFAGGFVHKNVLAKMMALATLVFLSMAWNRRVRIVALSAGAVAFALVVISGSATGLVVVVTMLCLLPLLRLLKEDVRLVVILGIVAVLALAIGALLAPQLIATIAPALGRDATLTRRTALWPLVLEMIRRRPWLGYGYQAFWLSGSGLKVGGWEPTQSHNGYLDLALTIGLVGLVLFGFVWVRGAARAIMLIRQQRSPASFWLLSYFCFLLLYNMTEVIMLTRNSVMWALSVSALITVSPRWTLARRSSKWRSSSHRAGRQRVFVSGTPEVTNRRPPIEDLR